MKFVAVLITFVVPCAAASELTVTNKQDGAPGSLRSMLLAARSGDRVVFDTSLAGETLVLSQGPLQIPDGSITLDGSGLDPAVTISGGGTTRLLSIGGSFSSMVVDSIVFANGASASGGAITCSQSLTLRRCTFRNNRAANGGAIHHTGSFGTSLLIENCTFDSNVASTLGGAIYLDARGSVELRSCTLTGNVAQQQGGAIYIRSSSPIVCRDSVIAENTTGFSQSDVYPIQRLTPSGASSGNLIGIDPLLAPLGDYGGPLPTRAPLAGSPVIDPASNATTSPLTTDQRGETRVTGPRVDSGAVEHSPENAFVFPIDGETGVGLGPTSATWSIEADADTFEVFIGTTSGVLELIGTTEVGRFELPQSAAETTYYWRIDALRAGLRTTGTERNFTTRPVITVTTLIDEDDGTADPATGAGTSLREAVRAANINPGSDRIEFDPGLDGGTIILGGTRLSILDSLQIDAAPLPHGLSISANHLSSIIEAAAATTVVLDRLTLTKASGGAINSSGRLVLRDCQVAGNEGGTATVIAKQLEFDRTSIVSNRISSTYGGVVSAIDLIAQDSSISANTCQLNGYIIAVGNSGDLSNLTIADNTGVGLVKNGSGELQLRQITLIGNFATFTSGLKINSGSVSLENCVIAGNNIKSTVTNPDLQGNVASQLGFNFIGGDPRLAPLGNYGGPTFTRPPIIGSPLIDPSGGLSESELTVDQRGFPRLIGGIVDAGAVEFEAGPSATPHDGAMGIASYRTPLYWASDAGADSFEVFVGSDAAALSSVGTTSEGIWMVEVLEPNTTYFWRVDSTTGGLTTIGRVRSFTTRPALEVTTAIDEDDGTADPTAGSGISLREAIAACTDTIDSDVIRFDPALDGGSIVLTGSPVVLADGVLIDASPLGSGLTVSANRLSGAIHLPEYAQARIQGLSIRDGEKIGTTRGYGVFNQGTLSLVGCKVTANRDSGVYSDGRLVMEDCLVHRNRGTLSAGGFSLRGESHLRRTTIANNWASSRGGIENYDFPLVLEQCTVTGNRSNTSTSAISSNSGDVTLRQCTVAENQMRSSSSITVSVAFATLTIENSIVVAPSFANTISTNNLIERGTNLTSGNPLLTPLGYYGGLTPTMLPLAASPAIDPPSGTLSSAFEFDQNGGPRIVGSVLDLGAVEFQNDGAVFPAAGELSAPSYQLSLAWGPTPDALSYEVFLGPDSGSMESIGTTTTAGLVIEHLTPETTYSWRVDATTSGGIVTGTVHSFTTRPALLVGTDEDEDDVFFNNGTGISLREALLQAGELLGGDTIHFDPALNGGLLPLDGAALLVDSSVAIDASDQANGVAISGALRSTVFEVPSDAEALFIACTIRDAGFNPSLGTSSGSGIRNLGKLKLSRCSVVDNRAKVEGGGIDNDGTLEIENSTIAGNRAYFFGGGIANDGMVSILNSTISANFASDQGAGIRDTFGETSIANTIIAGNFHSVDVYGTIDAEPSPNLIGTDPMLAPLGYYGGPTPTMPPLAGSPAIDPSGGATTTPFPIDQRGQARIVGSSIDIGAVERTSSPFQAPADGQAGVPPLRTHLVWNGIADSYEIFFGSEPGALESIGSTEASTFRLDSLQPETTYFWRIDTTTGGITESGTVWSFTTRSALLVTTATDEDDGSDNPAQGSGTSLREALAAARVLPGGDLIHFAPSLAGITIQLNGQALEIDDEIRIDASALERGPIVSANGNSRVIELEKFSSLELDGFSLVAGSSTYGGGVEGTFSKLLLSRMNLSDHHGGALRATRCDVTVQDTSVWDCQAIIGGGLYAFGGSLRVIQSTIASNQASTTGGGIFADSCDLQLLHSTITGNSASNSGGIYVYSSTSESYHSSIIAGNEAATAPDFGGSPQATPVDCLVAVDPKLAPLGDYGGRTRTMLPLHDSPVIDAAAGSTATRDQRGFSIMDGSADIGAVEYRGNADLALLWSMDFDLDGNPYGVEHALGTNPFASDHQHPYNLTVPNFANGAASLSFGRNPDAADHTIWILKRSTTLLPGSFVEIYRFEGPSSEETLGADVSVIAGSSSFTVTDEKPPTDRAFYRFEADIAPGP